MYTYVLCRAGVGSRKDVLLGIQQCCHVIIIIIKLPDQAIASMLSRVLTSSDWCSFVLGCLSCIVGHMQRSLCNSGILGWRSIAAAVGLLIMLSLALQLQLKSGVLLIVVLMVRLVWQEVTSTMQARTS
jgi:hypothetical protein